MEPDIQRVNRYDDCRFSPKVLRQHGAFIVDGTPYEVEITGRDSAVVRGERPELYSEVIQSFRFYAGHITRFTDSTGEWSLEFPPVELFTVKLEDIQPSQFYVDQEKLAAVRDFVKGGEDVVIPVTPMEGRYISHDGHTRLAAAAALSVDKVFAFIAPVNEGICGFVQEARRRGVESPYELEVIPHEEYEIKWDQFCDEYFQRMEDGAT